MFASVNKTNGLKRTRIELFLIGFIFIMSALYVMISSHRFFNFDEFQVMYASASLLKGKVLYADRIETHFPLCNILMSIVIYFSGFKISAMLFARYFILLANGIALYFVYRIGQLIWERKTGLLSVALILSVVVFVNKGIEIRHDVFNSMFNVIGCYCALKYLDKKEYSYLLVSGLCLGMAVASTQKSLVWSMGIILGVFCCLLKEKSYRNTYMTMLSYATIIPIPLIICVAYPILFSDESLSDFLRYSISNVLFSYAPHTPSVYPFPYTMYDLLKELVFQNPMFYSIVIACIASMVAFPLRISDKKIVLLAWTLVGILFFITAKRPFYQSFLPTIPPMAILAGGFISDLSSSFARQSMVRKSCLTITCILFLFIWPFHLIFPKAITDSLMKKQIENISYCLACLGEEDKVLCFTQNQVFFDPVFQIKDRSCGTRFYNYDEECFEQKMINEQCKIIINDYRTGLMNKGSVKKIRDNYVSARVGDILIPGFTIDPEKSIRKRIWIKGYYYSPTLSLMIDGRKIGRNLILLNQPYYSFLNLSDRPVTLVYIFKPENIYYQPELLKGDQGL